MHTDNGLGYFLRKIRGPEFQFHCYDVDYHENLTNPLMKEEKDVSRNPAVSTEGYRFKNVFLNLNP